jgi:hypothetical protein
MWGDNMGDFFFKVYPVVFQTHPRPVRYFEGVCLSELFEIKLLCSLFFFASYTSAKKHGIDMFNNWIFEDCHQLLKIITTTT